MNEFYQLSKGFKTRDNLDEICDLLVNIFLSKKVSIVKKSQNLLMILKVIVMSGKEQEINIELNHVANNDNYYKNNIMINQLQNKIKELKKDKNMLLNRINELENKIDIQNKEMEDLENTIFEKINNIENMVYNQNNEIDKINYLYRKRIKRTKR